MCAGFVKTSPVLYSTRVSENPSRRGRQIFCLSQMGYCALRATPLTKTHTASDTIHENPREPYPRIYGFNLRPPVFMSAVEVIPAHLWVYQNWSGRRRTGDGLAHAPYGYTKSTEKLGKKAVISAHLRVYPLKIDSDAFSIRSYPRTYGFTRDASK